MKTKNRNYLFSAVLIGIAMLMTACAVERDNAVWNNPLGDKIYGLWYADYQESGIVGNDTPYSRVVQAERGGSLCSKPTMPRIQWTSTAATSVARSTIAWLPTAPSEPSAGVRRRTDQWRSSSTIRTAPSPSGTAVLHRR